MLVHLTKVNHNNVCKRGDHIFWVSMW